MKIVLFALNSSYIHSNPAVRAIFAKLSDAGVNTSIVEKNLKDKRDSILFDLFNLNADIYGFSAYIWNINQMLSIASDLKALLPSAKIIFGGPQVASEDLSFLSSHPFIDQIMKGDGESGWLNLSELKIAPPIPYHDFINDGILYDLIPPPLGNSIVYYESSRGCPFNCSFCFSSLSHGITAKSSHKTLDDLLQFEKLDPHIRIVKFIDRTFNFNLSRTKEIWYGLLNPIYTKKYHFEICADLLDDECFHILSLFPKDKIQLEIGIQSTNTQTLLAVHRNNPNPNAALHALQKIRNLPLIHTHVDLIAGLPFENYSSFANSFNDVCDKCNTLQLGFLKLLKGTSIQIDSQLYGYIYMDEPPFTILQNDFLSFNEIHKLHIIASLLERFLNSGNFMFTLDYIFSSAPSVFAFFDGLADFIGDSINSLSQIKAYELLYSYASPLFEYAKSYLKLDFLLHESGNCPSFLQSDELFIADIPTLKAAFFQDSKKYNLSYCHNALEIHSFDFDPNTIFYIDRKNSNVLFKSSNI